MMGDGQSASSATGKRRRVEEELREDTDIWLSDGNIVLTAKDEEGTSWAFKCHSSILSRHSTVFQGMFTLDQPDNAATYTGLPLVSLTDSYADLKGLLQMLHLPVPSLSSPLRWQDELRQISGPLRLSKKYEFDTIYNRLSAFLESRWPVTLEGWDKVADCIQSAQNSWSENLDDSLEVNPVSTILLAEELGMESLLPALYYTLHTSWRTAHFDLYYQSMEEFEVNVHLPADLTKLSSHQHKRLAEGSHHLRLASMQLLIQQIPYRMSRLCHREACGKAVANWAHSKIIVYTPAGDLFVDPLSAFQEMRDHVHRDMESMDRDPLAHPLCFNCQDRLTQVLGACCRYIWEELPYLFNLKRREGDSHGFLSYFEQAMQE